jgi:hypothetical protein
MIDEGRQCRAEGVGVLLAEVDLVLRAIKAEPHGPVCGAAVKVIL